MNKITTIASLMLAATLLGSCAAIADIDVAAGPNGGDGHNPLCPGMAATSGNIDPTGAADGDHLIGPLDVDRVVDGDTLIVETGCGATTVRIIGIDTPETVHPDRPVEPFGPEASAAAAAILEGHRVVLETDPGQDLKDRYGRVLAHVWTIQESAGALGIQDIRLGDLVSVTLAEQGLADELIIGGESSHAETISRARGKAIAQGEGMWGGK